MYQVDFPALDGSSRKKSVHGGFSALIASDKPAGDVILASSAFLLKTSEPGYKTRDWGSGTGKAFCARDEMLALTMSMSVVLIYM